MLAVIRDNIKTRHRLLSHPVFQDPSSRENISPPSKARLTRADTSLCGLAATSAAVVHLALGLRIGADVLEGSSVLVVSVDAGELTAVLSSDTLNVNVALALGRAVSAGAVQLAVVLDVEVNDVDGAAAVVLDDLVGAVVRAAADDPGLLAGFVVLDRECVFAHVLPPDVLESAVAGAVDTLGLVLADDDVAEGGALVEVENGVLVA
ncbi:hypothetical protein OPT61_g10749 [Boeremia exigua]|uniref:Uncharacterized protein n=1 Tax=Boeremia exigua TaxID=749465 RepID=A0ACC2HN02_9PLEO|nr:hypothetical protein OPT61_g10749 [Boeremia exigua]